MIEKGTQLRIKLIGTRSDVGSMFAIGSIKEDFLGYVILICSSIVLICHTGRCDPSEDLSITLAEPLCGVDYLWERELRMTQQDQTSVTTVFCFLQASPFATMKKSFKGRT